MSDAPELRPCPFCGEKADQDYSQFYRPISGGSLGKACAIYCACGAYMMECREDHPGVSPEDLMADLVAAWNTRSDRGYRVKVARMEIDP